MSDIDRAFKMLTNGARREHVVTPIIPPVIDGFMFPGAYIGSEPHEFNVDTYVKNRPQKEPLDKNDRK
tara:strand:+ start:234 stop:437 length:204 start_codon:yes stop_codon:yes gene_type:complete